MGQVRLQLYQTSKKARPLRNPGYATAITIIWALDKSDCGGPKTAEQAENWVKSKKGLHRFNAATQTVGHGKLSC